jgi:hypothetical protein
LIDLSIFSKYIDTNTTYQVDEEVTPIKSKKVIKGKKIVGSKIDTWNRGYKPGGGNLKIFNEGLKFEDKEEPIIETYDRTYTKHQGVVQIQTDIDAPEETTIEVTTRPFEVEQTSRTVTVTREMKKPPTPEPIQVINLIH